MKGKLLDFPLYFFAFLEYLLLQYKNIFKYIKTHLKNVCLYYYTFKIKSFIVEIICMSIGLSLPEVLLKIRTLID